MSPSTSPSTIKFLFDENVDKRLERFFKSRGVDIEDKPKGLANGKLAEFSKLEKRIFVTNDEDFPKLYKNVFSLVWLRISQRKLQSSIVMFDKLINEIPYMRDFEGKLITLYEDRFKISELA